MITITRDAGDWDSYRKIFTRDAVLDDTVTGGYGAASKNTLLL